MDATQTSPSTGRPVKRTRAYRSPSGGSTDSDNSSESDVVAPPIRASTEVDQEGSHIVITGQHGDSAMEVDVEDDTGHQNTGLLRADDGQPGEQWESSQHGARVVM